MNLVDLGHRIRSQREQRHLKQSDLAAALHVSPQAVSKWERGENAPDIGLLISLGVLLGVSVEWLLGAYEHQRDVFEATVLASGVIGAREKSEVLSPRDFAAWTNSQCTLITETVRRFDGVPVKYLGPGILCFFSGANHAGRAATAAVTTQAASDMTLKVGLSSGEVYWGPIGHPDHAQPDIMGEAVSMAMLAADWAASEHHGGIVGCESTTRELDGDAFELGRQEQVTFRGIRHAVSVRTILSR